MTIKEIARLAGVSSAAVSRYLNGGYVSGEKKERIRRVIEETGYHPSAQARNLRTKRARLIGVIAPKLSSESIARVTDGIGQVLAESGYQMLLMITNNRSEKELEYMKIFENYPVDGMILIGTTMSQKHERFIKEAKVPLVVIGQFTENANCVYHDDYGAAKELAEKLAESGKRRIAYIGVGREDQAVGGARADGFRDGLKEKGIELDNAMCRISEFSVESGFACASDLLETYSDIDIISCATDTIAAGAIKAVRKKGRSVQVTGFGDNQFLKAVLEGITTVHFYYKTSGSKSAEMLLDIVEKGQNIPMQMKLGYRIVEG